MGQYHVVYNKTKKESYRVGGAKLWEKAYDGIEAKLAAISGRWAGDEIVIQGDYAEAGDPSFIPESELETYRDISRLVLDALDACISLEGDDKLKTVIKTEKKWIGA